MRDLVLTARPQLQPHAVTRVPTPKKRSQLPTRLDRPELIRRATEVPESDPDTSPYVDYGRYFTAQGGILIVYKDIDHSGWHSLWRLFGWSLFTGPEVWMALVKTPIETDWIRYVCCGVAALVNLIIVDKPVECISRVEIRPDCLILNDEQVFWQRFMESLPSFQSDESGNMKLTGIYGTRFVEYLTVHKFDEFDRTPQVMAAGFTDALQQLWLNRP